MLAVDVRAVLPRVAHVAVYDWIPQSRFRREPRPSDLLEKRDRRDLPAVPAALADDHHTGAPSPVRSASRRMTRLMARK